MRTLGWLVAIIFAVALAFALYRPQVVKTPVSGEQHDDDPPDEKEQPGIQ